MDGLQFLKKKKKCGGKQKKKNFFKKDLYLTQRRQVSALHIYRHI